MRRIQVEAAEENNEHHSTHVMHAVSSIRMKLPQRIHLVTLLVTILLFGSILLSHPTHAATTSCSASQYKAEDTTCQVCPKGGICLGDDLVLPDIGWWSTSNHSRPIQCIESSRCPGYSSASITLTTSQCSVGYTGFACSTCDTGYFRSADRCWSCGSDTESSIWLAVAINVGIAMLFLFAVAVSVFSPLAVATFVFVIILLQNAVAIGQTGVQNLDSSYRPLALVFTALSLINFDPEAFRSGCSKVPKFNYSEYFGWTMAYMGIGIFITLIVWPDGTMVKTIVVTRGGPAGRTEPDDSKKPVSKRPQALLAFACLTYFKVLQLQWTGIHCVSITDSSSNSGSVYVLRGYPNLQCFQDTHHQFVFAAIAFLALVYTIGLPLVLLTLLVRTYGDEQSKGVIGFLRKIGACCRSRSSNESRSAPGSPVLAPQRNGGATTGSGRSGGGTYRKYSSASSSDSPPSCTFPSPSTEFVHAHLAFLTAGVNQRHVLVRMRNIFLVSLATTLLAQFLPLYSASLKLLLIGLVYLIEDAFLVFHTPLTSWSRNVYTSIGIMIQSKLVCAFLGIQFITEKTQGSIVYISLGIFVGFFLLVLLTLIFRRGLGHTFPFFRLRKTLLNALASPSSGASSKSSTSSNWSRTELDQNDPPSLTQVHIHDLGADGSDPGASPKLQPGGGTVPGVSVNELSEGSWPDTRTTGFGPGGRGGGKDEEKYDRLAVPGGSGGGFKHSPSMPPGSIHRNDSPNDFLSLANTPDMWAQHADKNPHIMVQLTHLTQANVQEEQQPELEPSTDKNSSSRNSSPPESTRRRESRSTMVPPQSNRQHVEPNDPDDDQQEQGSARFSSSQKGSKEQDFFTDAANDPELQHEIALLMAEEEAVELRERLEGAYQEADLPTSTLGHCAMYLDEQSYCENQSGMVDPLYLYDALLHAIPLTQERRAMELQELRASELDGLHVKLHHLLDEMAKWNTELHSLIETRAALGYLDLSRRMVPKSQKSIIEKALTKFSPVHQQWLKELFEYHTFQRVCDLIVSEESERYHTLQQALSNQVTPRAKMDRWVFEQAFLEVNELARREGRKMNTASREYEEQLQHAQDRIREEKDRVTTRVRIVRAKENLRKRKEEEARMEAIQQEHLRRTREEEARMEALKQERVLKERAVAAEREAERIRNLRVHVLTDFLHRPENARPSPSNSAPQKRSPVPARFSANKTSLPSIPPLRLPGPERVIVASAHVPSPSDSWGSFWKDPFGSRENATSTTSPDVHLRIRTDDSSPLAGYGRISPMLSAASPLSTSGLSAVDCGCGSPSHFHGHSHSHGPSRPPPLDTLLDTLDDADDDVADTAPGVVPPPLELSTTPKSRRRSYSRLTYESDPEEFDQVLEHIHALHQLDSPPANIFKPDTMVALASGRKPVSVTHRASSVPRELPGSATQRTRTHRAMTPKAARGMETWRPSTEVRVSQTARARAMSSGRGTGIGMASASARRPTTQTPRSPEAIVTTSRNNRTVDYTSADAYIQARKRNGKEKLAKLRFHLNDQLSSP